MPDTASEFDTLNNFKRDTSRILKQLQETKLPIVLTVNGKAQVVVQDAASYQQMRERIERLETIAAVREGLDDVAKGRVRPAREALEELAGKHKNKPAKRR
jgi:prevent-host-death family protein